MKYKIWNKTDTLTTPVGEELTPEQVFSRYGWARREDAKAIICDAVIEMGVFMEFEQTKALYKRMIDEAIALGGARSEQLVPLTDSMSDSEVLAAISLFEEIPAAAEPSAEERIAAALEYLNLINMMN